MKEENIEYLAYIIKDAKNNGRPMPIFFIGAGVSVTGGIPQASKITKQIIDNYAENPRIKSLNENEKTYSNVMECLLPQQRNELLKEIVDNAQINVFHIYLAQLLKEDFVDYILTVNFDNLMLRALALYHIFPPTYDMAILKDLTTTEFIKKSVVYLHGQHHGLWLLNTENEMAKVEDTILRIIDPIKNGRPWIFVGYSASDPVFDHIINLGNFDNGLFWIGYKDKPLSDNIKKLLNKSDSNFYIKGYDADSFILKLNELLELPQPEVLDRPFTCLRNMVENINDIEDEDHLKVVRERLEIAKKNINKAIEIFEDPESKEVSIDNKSIEIDKLRKRIIRIIISDTYNEKDIKEIETEAKEYNDTDLNNILSDMFFSWGIYLGDLAQTKEGKEEEELYNQACEKYKKAIEIKPDKHEAFNNWGNDLGNLAQTKEGKEAEDLYYQAFEKYKKAIEIKPDYHKALYGWGTYLGNLAQTKEGKEAEDLYYQAFEKFKKAIEIKPDKHEAFNNWGNDLGNLAQTKEGKEAEDLYYQACEKYKKAIEIKPDYHKALYGWGTYLGNLAQTKEDKEAEDLYYQAFEKYEKAIEIKPDYHEAFYNWGTFLGNLAQTKEGKEAEDLYHQACEKFKKAIEIKPDKQEVFYNWGNALGNLAKTKEGKEAEDLYGQAFEKFKKAIELGGKSYNLACLFAIRKQKEEALKTLEVSLSKKEIDIEFILRDDDWKDYLDDPEFISLIEKYK